MLSLFEKIYEELNQVSPLPFDCGTLCGAVCCRSWSETPAAPSHREPGKGKAPDSGHHDSGAAEALPPGKTVSWSETPAAPDHREPGKGKASDSGHHDSGAAEVLPPGKTVSCPETPADQSTESMAKELGKGQTGSCPEICPQSGENRAEWSGEGTIYMLPGEEALHDREDNWLQWRELSAVDEGFPASWQDKVLCVRCKGPDHCKRELRPIQCRSFPLAPHISADGRLFMVYYDMELPYHCPILEDGMELVPEFVTATRRAWERLIREDARIYDLVYQDSRERERVNGGYRMA